MLAVLEDKKLLGLNTSTFSARPAYVRNIVSYNIPKY